MLIINEKDILDHIFFIHIFQILVHNFCSQAKQRATIKWILSKAYNNRIPENIVEPFYKDHDVRNI